MKEEGMEVVKGKRGKGLEIVADCYSNKHLIMI